MQWLIENWECITGAVAAASVVVNVTPNKTDNKYLAAALKVVNLVAVNINVKGVGNK